MKTILRLLSKNIAYRRYEKRTDVCEWSKKDDEKCWSYKKTRSDPRQHGGAHWNIKLSKLLKKHLILELEINMSEQNVWSELFSMLRRTIHNVNRYILMCYSYKMTILQEWKFQDPQQRIGFSNFIPSKIDNDIIDI